MQASQTESVGTAVALATAAEVPGTPGSRSIMERRASRLAARRAINALAGREVSVIIRRTLGGAPTVYLRGRPPAAPAGFALSLAHRDDRAAAVAAPAGARVGVDLERRDAVDPAHAGYFLTPRERVGRTLTLAELWALKEAAWKALALDGAVAFHELELHVDSGGRLGALTVQGRRLGATATLSTPWPGYVLATVVVEDAGC